MKTAESMSCPVRRRMRFSQILSFLGVLCVLAGALSVPISAVGQTEKPEWCRNLPRPEYKSLERVLPYEIWFEVYKAAPGTFAIYEPHQAEETISYLLIGTKQALLFDTGMGIGNIKALVARLTSRPIVVLNSHTHNDHVGGNWQFPFVLSMDTSFTRASAKGSRTDAQAEIAPDQLCGVLPIGFDPAKYSTKPWKVLIPVHDGFKVDLGHRTVQIIHTPGHTPDSICLIDRDNGLLFTGDTFYPGEIWLYRPETNFPAYVESVKTLASLAPEIKMILGAHNVPIAPPSVLPQLDTAIRDVLAGKVHPKYVDANQAVYQVGQISFRVHSPLPAMKPLPESN